MTKVIEAFGNIWDLAIDKPIVITTNGAVRKDGHAVMGRGIAFEAKEEYPDLSEALGFALWDFGNHVISFCPMIKRGLYTFPVKHHWKQKADLKLIERSAHELSNLIDIDKWDKVYVPRPGCGNGGLSWLDVKPVIEPILDDRFVVVTWKP